jgi:hypothetical protein
MPVKNRFPQCKKPEFGSEPKIKAIKKSKFQIPTTFILKVRRGKKVLFLDSFHPDFRMKIERD